MLFVALPFLLALWEYNLINIVERMSVEKKNAYIGVDLGGQATERYTFLSIFRRLTFRLFRT